MRTYIEAIVLAVISVLAIWAILDVPAAAEGETWAGIVPFGAAIGLLALSILLMFSAHSMTSSNMTSSDDGNSGASDVAMLSEQINATSSTRDILILFVIALVYQQSFRWFGYVLPTAIVAPIVFCLFGVRNILGLALSVILCPLAFHIIFFVLLGVFPPYGEVFDLLEIFKR